MSNYVIVNTPGGQILAEVSESADSQGIELMGISDKLPTFEEASGALRQNAKHILDRLLELQELIPDEVTISCGIKVGIEAGNAFWGLAKASSEASYDVVLTWKNLSSANQVD